MERNEKYSNSPFETASGSYNKDMAYKRAERRLKELKGFYWHLFWYLVVNAVIIVSSVVVNAEYFNLWSFNTFSTAIFWGIGLGVHALGVFGKNLVFSKNWEDRQIQKFMDKDKKRWE